MDAADANDTGRVLQANGESERAVLSQLDTFPTGPARRVGNLTVRAESPYPAASGRICRELHLFWGQAGMPRDRLACSNGAAWFFVPDVLAPGSAD